MKKRLLILFILTASVLSCTDNSWSGMSYEEVMEIDPDTHKTDPEPVNILVGNYVHQYGTKGSGPVENRYSWAESGPQVQVYAFRRNSHLFASKAVTGDGECLIDGTLDGNPTRLSGRTATFSAPDYILQWTSADSGSVLRYPYGKEPYDVYAYSTGGLSVEESSIVRDENCIKFPLVIDGTADIMYAKAELTESQVSSIPYLNLSEEDRNTFTQWCYSDFAARRGILPVLNFVHALTRISFDLYPVDAGCNEIMVTKVEVKSRDKCMFTVASADTLMPIGADFSGDGKDAVILLTETDGSKLNDTLYHTRYTGDFTDDILSRPHVRVGGSFLIPPEPEYTFMFYTRVIGSEDIVPSSVTLHPVKGGSFLAGSSYIVRVGMSKKVPIGFIADEQPWEGGNDQ